MIRVRRCICKCRTCTRDKEQCTASCAWTTNLKVRLVRDWLGVDVQLHCLDATALIGSGRGSATCAQVKIERPILRIPMLAIHLSRDIYTDGFKPNKQTHVVPILATAVRVRLDRLQILQLLLPTIRHLSPSVDDICDDTNKQPGNDTQGALGTKTAAKDSDAGKDASSSAAEPPENGGEAVPKQPTAPAERHHGLLLQMLADELVRILGLNVRICWPLALNGCPGLTLPKCIFDRVQ